MDANGTRDRGSAEVVGLQPRSSGQASASVSVRVHTSAPWTVIAVSGEMDALVGPLLSDLVSISDAHVVFELGEVTFMDASGLGALMGSQQKAVRAGGCVRLVSPSSQARRLLTLTRTDGVFLTFATVDEAISASALS